MKHANVRPFVKWAGGKRQILPFILRMINEAVEEQNGEQHAYIEPFLGGGAVFFELQPHKAVINDLNEELINAYNVIKSDDYSKLIDKLKEYEKEYKDEPDEFYYEIRRKDREPGWKTCGAVERAARMIFLNKTCYNGLYRVNKRGEFNTPMGRYSNPTICDEQTLVAVHDYLSDKGNDISILNESYEAAMLKATDGDIIYVDPPYDYEDDDGFTKYQLEGFSFEDFVKLKKQCDLAIQRGATVIISNNATDKVLELFKQDPNYKIYYNVTKLHTLRMINCKGAARKTGKEVVILGMLYALPQANEINKIVLLASKCNDEYIKNKEAIKVDLNLGSERQVAYYLSALFYLGYLDGRGEIAPKLLKLRGEIERVEEDIFSTLRNDLYCKEEFVYAKLNGKPVRKAVIEEKIASKNSNLSKSTIERRASTIKAWIEWMLAYSKENSKS